jgi:glycerol kinase
VIETTALGAAYLAGLAVGFWKDIEAIASQWKVDARFTPSMDDANKDRALNNWNRAVRAVLAWSKS